MRKKMRNVLFTILYPGHWPGNSTPTGNEPSIAIPDDGQFVSITGERFGGERSSAVFYQPQSLRDMAHVLEEAADLLEENRAKNRANKQRKSYQ